MNTYPGCLSQNGSPDLLCISNKSSTFVLLFEKGPCLRPKGTLLYKI